jgi:alpha-N-arabinofuranosidase
MSHQSIGVPQVKNPVKSITVNTTLNQVKWSSVTGQVLTSAKITDINTFDKPGTVIIKKFDGARKEGDLLNVVLPAKSVVLLTIK